MPAEFPSEIEFLRAALAEAAERERSHVERLAELARELERARAEARTDALTGSLNRRGLEEAWTRETARTERTGEPLALVVLDLDDFKRLNDECGHAAGDRALVLVSFLAQSVLRPGDGIARLGGEEFALLLPGADAPAARRIARRLAFALAREARPLRGGGSTLTFSAGVVVRGPGERLAAAIERADGALYEAKRMGKDQVVEAGAMPSLAA